MKNTLIIALLALSASVLAQTGKTAEIYIDGKGVMRRSDTKAEASFYGVNYTLPFAYAYRAEGYLGKDRKKAIDSDVYHLARLGFNAWRIHVWDVEISDGKGNLLENEHLDLLDYLVFRLQERGISLIITTMTNFGNGYPERNQPTGGFSYLYDKCRIHSDKDAIEAQKNYIVQFINHRNHYTGNATKNEPLLVGFEINNEPCHAETPQQTENYINTMLETMKQAGNSKPVFYNASHNMSNVQAYYNTDIQGGTFQWYPIGLVAGHTRKGNFLPYVDDYNIPFSNVKGFAEKSKIVYEFDPADITYSYMYPAMARTFRSKGFQWITQFAYDPMDLAYSNTEYQTHFLNLAYTPQKALSMKIAAEVARAVPRLAACPKYPADTVFGNFRVSYAQNLSEMNSKTKFFYSNNTDTQPISPQNLEEIAGFGNSPIVSYEGCGAYFLDRLGKGFWRLEVMPDAVQTSDPFAKASLKKRVVEILRNTWKMKILIPDLGKTFSIKALNAENTYNSESKDGGFMIRPGVYLLETKGNTESAKWASDSKWKNIRLGEFVAPESSVKNFMLVHNPPENAETGKALPIEAQIIGAEFPDSVLIYSDKISFWFDKNPYLKMERSSGYAWKAEIPEKWLTDGLFRYNAVVCKGDKRFTFPSGEEGSPLDWDFYNQKYYEIRLNEPDSPVLLFSAGGNANNLETYSIPAQGFALRKLNSANPAVPSRLDFELKYQNPETRFFWRKYVKNEMENRKYGIENAQNICLQLSVNGVDTVNIGLITSDGFTYSAIADLSASESVLKIPLDRLKQAPTALLPQPYPVFLDNHFVPDVQIPFDKRKIEMFEISVSGLSAENAAISLGNIWLE